MFSIYLMFITVALLCVSQKLQEHVKYFSQVLVKQIHAWIHVFWTSEAVDSCHY